VLAGDGLLRSGTPTDWKRAADLLAGACVKHHAFGCLTLGKLYGIGKGVAFDQRKARELYERACEYARPEGCIEAGVMYEQGWGTSASHARAEKFFEKACALKDAPGYPDGCVDLGIALTKSGSQTNRDRGNGMIKEACQKGSERACDEARLKEAVKQP
jgi:TPR repeat protein